MPRLSMLTALVQASLTRYGSEATLEDFLNFTAANPHLTQLPITTVVQKYGENLGNGSWRAQKSLMTQNWKRT